MGSVRARRWGSGVDGRPDNLWLFLRPVIFCHTLLVSAMSLSAALENIDVVYVILSLVDSGKVVQAQGYLSAV